MNSPLKQLMALISYWKKKCHVVSFNVDGDLSRIYERRDYCWCHQVDGNKFKQPFPIPMSGVVSFIAEKLNLEIIQYHNIDQDPELVHTEFFEYSFDFPNNKFTVTGDFSYLTEGDGKSYLMSTKKNPKLDEVLNDLMNDGKKGKYRVDFNGDGDEGYIDDKMGSLEIKDEVRIPSGLEDILYDFLEATIPGWEEENGGQGFFIIDLDKRTIRLNYTPTINVNEELLIYSSSLDELIQTISVDTESVE